MQMPIGPCSINWPVKTAASVSILAPSRDAETAAAVGQPGQRQQAGPRLAAMPAGGGVADLLTSSPGAGRFTVVGQLQGQQAAVAVRLGQEQTQTYMIDAANATDGSLLRCIWAQRKLAKLLLHQERDRTKIIALAKKYGLVTPYTSLMVLETLEQYLQYRIEPPKSLPDMRKEYQRRMAVNPLANRDDHESKMAEVVRLWEQRVEWWNTEPRRPEICSRARHSRRRQLVRLYRRPLAVWASALRSALAAGQWKRRHWQHAWPCAVEWCEMGERAWVERAWVERAWLEWVWAEWEEDWQAVRLRLRARPQADKRSFETREPRMEHCRQ